MSCERDMAMGEPCPGEVGPSDELVSDVFARGCSSRAALEDVGSKWGMLAMLALGEGRYRFNALRRRVEGVSEKMLSRTLQLLERDGLVLREVVSTIPARVEYSLTPLGGLVAAQLRVLADLFEGSAVEISRARTAYDAGRRP
ncbi:winged helix-turn-helix transcriptional regulator [Frankia gtarii]|uniref:winged helix-turn-helix transcriptional regulator n=1 Tax=Frankia gtarii TaxID=2950102 RepID=UPI0021BFC7A1|nr:helix-turn-helix domain-containing protein [Frankia gtarii]